MNFNFKFSEDAQLDLRPDTPEHFQVAVAGGTVLAGATAEQAAQIEQNASDIATLSDALGIGTTADYTFVAGGISSDGTVSNSATNRVRSENYIWAKAGSTIGTKPGSTETFNIATYSDTATSALLSYRGMSADPFTVEQDCYIRFGITASDTSDPNAVAAAAMDLHIITDALPDVRAQVDQNAKDITALYSTSSEYDVNSEALWESGQINSDGANNTNPARIRTIEYMPGNVLLVESDGQANVRAQLYTDDGTFVKVSDLGFTQSFIVADVLAEDESATKIRLTIQHIDTTTAIDTSFASHVRLMAVTDETFSIEGKSADAAATGAAIVKLEEADNTQLKRIQDIDNILDPVWEQGHIKMEDGTDGLPGASNFTRRIRTGFLSGNVRKISIDSSASLFVFRYDHDKNYIGYKEYGSNVEVTDFDHYTYLYRIQLSDATDHSTEIDLAYVAHVTIMQAINRPLVKFDIDHNMRDVSEVLSGVDLSDSALPEKTLEQVYQLFDGLVTAYPNYVTKSDAAELCSMTYPDYANGVSGSSSYADTPAYKTYLYSFSESNTYAGNDGTCRKAKLVIICGIHGNEYAAPYNAYLFAKQLCDGVLDDANFFKLRAAFDIYIIPCLNGYGMYHKLRTNANGVNINRNFPVADWKESGVDTEDYTGASAGSEFETKLVIAMTDYLNPDILIDHHNYSSLKRQFYATVCDVRWLGMMYQSLVDCSYAFKKKYPDYFGTGYALVMDEEGDAPAKVSMPTSKGTLARWMYENSILFAATVEISNRINYVGGQYTDTAGDYMGMDTFSVAEYTLRNVILHAAQYVLDHR